MSASPSCPPGAPPGREPPCWKPVEIDGTKELNFGLRWDFVGNEPIDMDASCVSFDASGKPGEAVFYNNLVTEGKWMLHTGDNTTGEGDDDDEAIQMVFDKIPERVASLVLVVTCHNAGCYLSNVKSLACVVTDMANETEFARIPVALSKDHTAIILCSIERIPSTQSWLLKTHNVACLGHSIGEARLIDRMQSLLDIAPSDKKGGNELSTMYATAKGEVAHVADLRHLMLGLGWEKPDVDLDASAVMLDKNGLYIDAVAAKTKHGSFDFSMKHSGDNAFDGSGDKETIHLHLDSVHQDVHFVYFAVTQNCKDNLWSSSRLGGSAGAYCRLVHIAKKNKDGKGRTLNADDRKELCRVNISKLSKDASALLFAVAYRSGHRNGAWAVVKCSDYVTETGLFIPGELLPLARCHSYFFGGWVAATGRIGVISETWGAFKELLHKRQHLRVTIVEARELMPQDEVFTCQCQLWLRDREAARAQRKKTASTSNRDHPQWDEVFSFAVTALDCIRVMVTHWCSVGVIDIPLFLPEAYKLTLWEELVSSSTDGWYPLQGS
eukprot:gene9458-14682_t